MVVDTVMYTVHTAFAALWTGSVLFVAAVVVPLAMAGELSPAAFGSVVSKLRWVTRLGALVTFVTGGHLAGTLYTVDTLTGTTGGYLVVAMLTLWLGLAAAIEVGSARAIRGVENDKIREPARDARPFYLLGSLLAVGLLVVSGLLGTPGAVL
jgi:hypothetical protein